jgi:hypothetical protein
MIDIASENTFEEEGAQISGVAMGDWETPAGVQDSVCAPAPEPHPRDPLEWYLMKLLAPIEEAPRELVPPWGDEETLNEPPMPAPEEEEHANEMPELPLPALPDNHEPRGAAEAPKEAKLLWQNTGQSIPAAPAAGSVPSTTAESSPPKSKPKPALRSLRPKERSGSGRQKLMMALIPVLAILMVFVLKHPLGAHATVIAAGAQQNETTQAAVTDVQIAWEIPSVYEASGRDPMQTTPAPAVAVEGAGATDQRTEPPVDLVVTGILHSDDRPAAIVDTQVVHEGQQISGATVEKIEKDGVQFERNGRRWKQALKQ